MPRLGAVASALNPLSKDDPLPLMAVYKDRCLIVTAPNKRAQYLSEGKTLNRQRSIDNND
jgi:hypothetical protein